MRLLRLAPLSALVLAVAAVASTGPAGMTTPVAAAPAAAKAHDTALLAPAHHDQAPPGVDVTAHVPTSTLLATSHVATHPARQTTRVRKVVTHAARATNGTVVTAHSTSAEASIQVAATAPPGTSDIQGLSSHVDPSCSGTGTDGDRVQVIYAVEAGQTNRYSQILPTLQSYVADIDDTMAVSSQETGGGRRVRWVHDASCVPVIANVTLPAGSMGTSTTDWGSDFNATEQALQSLGYNDPTRKYLVFADSSLICGIAAVYIDSAKTSGNANNGGYPMFARVDTGCWSTPYGYHSIPAHELMHTLGSVQPDAPHATEYGHCTDQYEVMCYADGTTKAMQQVCPRSHDSRFDCGDDDYFNAGAVTSGSYLAGHWNTADSAYLDAAPVLSSLPTPSPISGPSSMVAGTTQTFRVSPSTWVDAYTWSTNWSQCSLSAATNTSVNLTCPYNLSGITVALSYTETSSASGQAATVTTNVTTTAPAGLTVSVTGPALVVDGQSATYTATSSNQAASWSWAGSTFAPCTTQNPTPNQITITCPAGVQGTANLQATATDVYGQTATGHLTPSLTPAPMLSASLTGPTGLHTSGGVAETGQVTAVSSNPATSYAWAAYPSACLVEGAGTATVTLRCPATYTGTLSLSVTVTDVYGQSATASTSINVDSSPALTVALNGPSQVTAGGSDTVTLTASNLVVDVAWSVAPTTCTISGTRASATFACPVSFTGPVNVTAAVTDTYGQKATGAFAVAVAAPTPTAPTPTPMPTPVVQVGPDHDFTSDHHPDVLARRSDGSLWMYLGNGSGGFSSDYRLGFGWNAINALLVDGDVNGDGRTDLIARDVYGNLWLYPGDGRGHLGARARIGTGWQGFTALVASGDWDGDGHPDLLARDRSGNLSLYRGDGHGGWLGATRVGTGWQAFNSIVAPGDWDGDGHLDLLARDGYGNLFLYRGDGHGGWLGATRVGTGWQVFGVLLAEGDWSGDGHPDVLAPAADGSMWLYRGNGRGGWVGASRIGTGWQVLTGLA